MLLLNAGVSLSNYDVYEGNEATITINVISTCLLALLLVPDCEKPHRDMQPTAKASSMPSTKTTISLKGIHEIIFFHPPQNPIFPTHPWSSMIILHYPLKPNPRHRYPISKILQCFFVRAIAPHTNPASKPTLILNCLTPGYCYSDITRDHVRWRAAVISISRFTLGRSTEVGSRCLVHAARAGEESHGKFLGTCSVIEYSPYVRSSEGEEVQGRVFRELVNELERSNRES